MINESNYKRLTEEELFEMASGVKRGEIFTDTVNSTYIYPYIVAPIVHVRNTVFCLSFQLAWNELKRKAGKDILFDNAQEAVEYLNSSKISINDINAKNIIVAAEKNYYLGVE